MAFEWLILVLLKLMLFWEYREHWMAGLNWERKQNLDSFQRIFCTEQYVSVSLTASQRKKYVVLIKIQIASNGILALRKGFTNIPVSGRLICILCNQDTNEDELLFFVNAPFIMTLETFYILDILNIHALYSSNCQWCVLIYYVIWVL